MITIHPVCGLIPSTKWNRNRKKGEKSVARTQVYSHGQVRVLGVPVWTQKEAITGAVGAYHAIECTGFPARVPCLHGSSHARHVGIQLPACCLYDKIHDMSDPPTCCFVWAYTLNVSWACPDFFTMFLCTSPFGPSCLPDVNIITCRKTQIFEVSLMLISSGAEKQESLNFIWG